MPIAVLLTALLYDLLDEAMGERRGFQDAFNAIHQRFSELVTRLCIPRREWDAMCNLVARQSSLTRIPDPMKGKGFEKRFVRNTHFPNALLFFEIYAEATGKNTEELKYWKGRAARALHEGENRPHEGGRHNPDRGRHPHGGDRR